MTEELKVVVSMENRLSAGMGAARLSLTDLKSGLDLAAGALRQVQAAVNATVTPTIALAEQQRDLARSSGATAEESGALIQAADDLKVSYGTLQVAAKSLTREGLSLNLDTIKQLAAEYQALPDPVSKAQFAAEKFGARAGPEMTKLLEQSTAELEALGQAALDSGLVLSGEAVDAAREYELAQDELNDTLESAKVIVGQELIPALTDLTRITSAGLIPAIKTASDWFHRGVDAGEQLADVWQLLKIKGELARGEIDENEASLRTYIIATEDADFSVQNATENLDGHVQVLLRNRDATRDATAATDDNRLANQGATDVWRTASGALRDLNVTEFERELIEQRLKLLTGEITQADIDREAQVEALTESYRKGKLTMNEYVQALADLERGAWEANIEVNNLAGSVKDLKSKTITITTRFRTEGEPSPEAGEVGIPGGAGAETGEPGSAGAPPGEPEVEIGGMRQHGGAVRPTAPNVTLVYSPLLSLADEVELQTRLKPLLENLLRK